MPKLLILPIDGVALLTTEDPDELDALVTAGRCWAMRMRRTYRVLCVLTVLVTAGLISLVNLFAPSWEVVPALMGGLLFGLFDTNAAVYSEAAEAAKLPSELTTQVEEM